MLKLPGNLTPEKFLKRYWQKQPLFMPQALDHVRPAISRNELGWLATLDDVESRLVFVDRDGSQQRYRAEAGPFDPEYLRDLPKRDWSLLVHDVDKHLPALRSLFGHVPFIPDWRFDDLMVSFAAPGGGVGPHRDNYDVFLCQGIGVRNWRFTIAEIESDPTASDDLALLQTFDGDEEHDNTEGDVLYLPPATAHWGIAKRACMTYSMGMRAPQAGDIALALNSTAKNAAEFYRDPDLDIEESRPGCISASAVKRATALLGLPTAKHRDIAAAIGRFATQPKDWLAPEETTREETQALLELLSAGGRIQVHGMARIAFDDHDVYINGHGTRLLPSCRPLLQSICADRVTPKPIPDAAGAINLLRWMLNRGAFEIPENY
jgi:50S ribosomal protein L16 3-hydroxylase